MPPCPPPVLRPTLHATDVVLAVRSVLFARHAEHLVPTLMERFHTDLSPVELATRMGWMLSLRRNLASFLRERILQGHVVCQSPEQILTELFQPLERLAAELQ